MPALIAFGRRWSIASDDFVFPAITEFFARIFWTIIIVVLFSLSLVYECGIPISVNEHATILLSFILMFLSNLPSLILCMTLSILSSRGSIFNVKARKPVVMLLYLRIPVFLLEVACTIFSTIVISNAWKNEYQSRCHWIFGVYMFLPWILVIFISMATILMFNPFAMSNINMDSSEERSYWRWQLRLCKVFPDTEMHNAITDIAALLASFFHGSDMVLSDVVAGLLLVAHSPHQKPPPESEDEPSNVIWMKLPESTHEIKRIFDFASAVYGWPIYLITHRGCIPWCRLCRNIIKCRKCRWNKEIVIKDNCFMCNTAAFLLGTNTAKSDLVFVSFRNRLYQSPFIVLVDHKSSSIIIVIRGSFSFTDVFTDLMLSDATLGGSVDVNTDDVLFQDKSLDDNGEVRVHFGMLKTARKIYELLQNKRILENLFAKNPDYKLVITGHSLGAGVASLLTLLYKKTYSSIRCYAFSPPGCVISENGISDTEKHVLSIIIGDDMIPRTSYQSLLRLKLAIDREIHSTNLPKYKILAQGLYRLLLKKPCNFVPNKIPSYLQHEYRGIEAESTRVQLYPPGKLLHLNPKEEKVIASFIKHEFIKDIQLTSSMLSDHMLMKVRKVLRKLDENNS